MQRTTSFVVATVIFVLATNVTSWAKEPESAGLDLFEKKIRPVLVAHCYECHSSAADAKGKLKGGLRVDTRDALRIGGESGAAVVPEKPDESLLISALKYDSFQMPPKRRLSNEIVADFVKWIELGAPDPRTDAAPAKSAKKGIDIEAGRKHWCYQLPQAAPIPAVKNKSWPAGEIDHFVLTQIEARGLKPAAEADKVTLVRRVYFDLIGLPPTPEQIDQFLADARPDAYERLVDQLLQSPHFGERWGRHWLDVARFAESLTLRGFVLKDAWRYRDYVIDAFNTDLPFNQFVREQVAGDLLQEDGDSLEVRRRKLTATSFLAIGNTNLEEQDKKTLVMDVVDEQLETVGKAFLAQTLGCARCHDHKFDPIPTRDYYALAGILKNSKTLEHSNVSKWIEVPLPVPDDIAAKYREYEEQVAGLKRLIDAGKKSAKRSDKKDKSSDKLRSIEIASLPGIVVDDSQAKRVGEWTTSAHTKPHVGESYLHDGNQSKGAKTLTFDPEIPTTGRYEVRLAYSPDDSRSSAVPVTVFSADGEKTIVVNQQDPGPIDQIFVSLGQYRFESTGQSYVMISNEGTSGFVTADALVFIPVEKLLATTDATKPDAAKPDKANSAATSDTAPKMSDDELKKLEEQLKKMQDDAPQRETVVAVVEEKQIEDVRVHIRGSVQNLGERVPRGFLQVATYEPQSSLPTNQSGRRELAHWLSSDRNPLTARVMTNRVWHWLLGSGLVRTTDNFGLTGEKPSHPELLDHLTVKFMSNRWSVKQLVREIVLSKTYRQSTVADPQTIAGDLDNRLFARANRQRLEAECLRDAMLQVSGRLNLERGGPSFPMKLASDFGYQSTDLRRSVYVAAFRNALPEALEVFDAADPSSVTGRRNVSTVSPQALYLMNHPFVLDLSQATAERLLNQTSLTADDRIVRAYRELLGRAPQDSELAIAKKFVEHPAAKPTERWALFIQSLFGSIEFRYVD